jgi:hypothetical protein
METIEFRVWYQQINRCHIDVQAADKCDAIEKAFKIWRREYGHPLCDYVEATRDDT